MASITKNRKFQQIVKTEHLPTLPEIAQRLIEIAKQPDPDTEHVCQVIKSDPALSAKILKTVNSAIFAFRPRVETIENAVPRLGSSLIRTLILNFHLANMEPAAPERQTVFQKLWCSCLTQAVIAEILATKSLNDAPLCFMGAMLQDLGILAMASEFYDEYCENVLSVSQFPNVIRAERAHFGFTHVDVTLGVLKQWNLERTFGNVIASHHDAASDSWHLSGNADPSTILQAASLGADLILNRQHDRASKGQAVEEWLQFLGTHFDFNDQTLEPLFNEIDQRVTDYSALYQFDVGAPPCTHRLMADANKILHEIAIQNQISLLSRTEELPNKRPENNELFRDFQTDLFNRRYLSEHLFKVIADWARKKWPLAMLFIDIDKFKSINDTYGHHVGDVAIEQVAAWLKQNLRENDYPFRLSGDEFLAVLQIKESHFRKIVKRIGSSIPSVRLADGVDVPITLSMGGIVYAPKKVQPLNINDLIAYADQLMYQVKRRGGNHAEIRQLTSVVAPVSHADNLLTSGSLVANNS